MRAFIAIEISEEIRSMLDRIEAHLKYAGADVKWVGPENIHLTLKFLGEITEEKCADVKSALDEVARSAKPFELTLKNIGVFPKMEFPRVVWVGIDSGQAEGARLAANIDEAMSNIGFEKDSRPFSPHLTIGRVRSGLNKDKLREKIASASANFQLTNIAPHKVNSVILFQSTLTQQGPIYTKIHESRFTA